MDACERGVLINKLADLMERDKTHLAVSFTLHNDTSTSVILLNPLNLQLILLSVRSCKYDT